MEMEVECSSIQENDLCTQPTTTTHKGKSRVWDFFEKVSAHSAKCNKCNKMIKINLGSTTGLRRHITNVHQISISDGTQVNEITRNKNKKSVAKLDKNDPRAKKITQAIGMFLVSDLQPYSSVEGKGFLHLMETVSPNYSVPCRTTFSRTIIPDMYDSTVDKLKNKLEQDLKVSNIKRLNFTTDGWTSAANDSYLSLTIHYIDNEFNLNHFTLALTYLSTNHTSENLLKYLKDMLNTWDLNIPNTQMVFVTDNARNIVKVIELSPAWERIPCFNHTLQLAIRDVEKMINYEEIAADARKIVGFFKRSSTAWEKLKEAQKMLNPDKRILTLEQEIVTRWNSRFKMFKRLKDLRQPLAVVLSQPKMPDNLTQYQWSKIEDYVDVFASLTETTVLMEGDEYPSSSLYLSIVLGFEQILSSDEDCSYDQEQLLNKVRETISERFSFALENNNLLISMLVDPRYKDRFLLSNPEKRTTARDLLLEKTLEYGKVNSNDTQPAEEENRLSSNISRTKLEKFLASAMISNKENNDVYETLKKECFSYLDDNVVDTDPLIWWKEHKNIYPNVVIVAQNYLGCPASESVSERVFSTAGNIVTSSRVTMLSDHVEQTCFLHDNVHLI